MILEPDTRFPSCLDLDDWGFRPKTEPSHVTAVMLDSLPVLLTIVSPVRGISRCPQGSFRAEVAECPAPAVALPWGTHLAAGMKAAGGSRSQRAVTSVSMHSRLGGV